MEKQLLSKSLGLYGWAEESFLVHATVNGSVVFRLRINSFRHNNTFGYGRSLKDSYLGITFESRFGCLSFVMWKQSIALTFCPYQAFEKARYRIKMCSIASIFKNIYNLAFHFGKKTFHPNNTGIKWKLMSSPSQKQVCLPKFLPRGPPEAVEGQPRSIFWF